MTALTRLVLEGEIRRLPAALAYVVEHEWVADTGHPAMWVREFADVARNALAGGPVEDER